MKNNITSSISSDDVSCFNQVANVFQFYFYRFSWIISECRSVLQPEHWDPHHHSAEQFVSSSFAFCRRCQQLWSVKTRCTTPLFAQLVIKASREQHDKLSFFSFQRNSMSWTWIFFMVCRASVWNVLLFLDAVASLETSAASYFYAMLV